MKYIAYGSNMVEKQMAVRCPAARVIGVGYLVGARLEFYLHATVEKSGDPTDRVPVTIWEITPEDESALDWYEGYPSYYTKESWCVQMADGSEIEGMIYIMRTSRAAPPIPQYYKDIEDAYRKLGLSFQIRKVLRPAYERSIKRGYQ